MTLFGWTLIRVGDLIEADTAVEKMVDAHREELDFWKAKYFYAKARAIVAERFRNPVISVRAHPFPDHYGVEIEVGIRPPEPES